MFHSSRIRACGPTTTGEGGDGGERTPESRGDGAQRRFVRIYEPRFAITPNFPNHDSLCLVSNGSRMGARTAPHGTWQRDSI